jgi:hypothetical protein
LIDPICKELDYKLVPRSSGFKRKEDSKKNKLSNKSLRIAMEMRRRLAAGTTVEQAAEEVGALREFRCSGRYVIKLWGNIAKTNPKFWLKKKNAGPEQNRV